MVINESVNSLFNMILLQLAFEPAQRNSNNRGSNILGYAALTQPTSVLFINANKPCLLTP
jgi:hypothetical protein